MGRDRSHKARGLSCEERRADVGSARPARACRRQGPRDRRWQEAVPAAVGRIGGVRARREARKQIRRLLGCFMVDSVKHVKSRAVC